MFLCVNLKKKSHFGLNKQKYSHHWVVDLTPQPARPRARDAPGFKAGMKILMCPRSLSPASGRKDVKAASDAALRSSGGLGDLRRCVVVEGRVSLKQVAEKLHATPVQQHDNCSTPRSGADGKQPRCLFHLRCRTSCPCPLWLGIPLPAARGRSQG